MLYIRKRQLKRCLAAFLSAAMILSNTSPAFAVDEIAAAAVEETVETEAAAEEAVISVETDPILEELDDADRESTVTVEVTGSDQTAAELHAAVTGDGDAEEETSAGVSAQTSGEETAAPSRATDDDASKETEADGDSKEDKAEKTLFDEETGELKDGGVVEDTPEAKEGLLEKLGGAADAITEGVMDLLGISQERLDLLDGMIDGATKSDAEIVDAEVIVEMEHLDEKSAPTGTELGFHVVAFNDNPNAEARAKVRIYMDEGTNGMVTPVFSDEAKNGFVMLLADPSDVSGQPLEIIGEWDDTGKFVEFELPSGASIDAELSFTTPTGLDENVYAWFYAEYCMIDDNGDEVSGWTEAVAPDTDDDLNANRLQLYWYGAYKWAEFEKTASQSLVSYNGSSFGADEIEYTFDAKNLTMEDDEGNIKTEGVIYTDSLTLTDTITLPAGIGLPEELDSSDGIITTAEGKPLYEVKIDSAYDGQYTVTATSSNATATASNATAAQCASITFTVTINNSDEATKEDTSWNPIGAITAVLYPNELKVWNYPLSTEKTIVNKAEVHTESPVTTYKGTDQIFEWDDEAEAEVSLFRIESGDLEKYVDRVVSNGTTTSYGKDSQEVPLIQGGDLVYYHVVAQSNTPNAYDMSFEDEMPAALAYTSDYTKVTYTVPGDTTEYPTRDFSVVQTSTDDPDSTNERVTWTFTMKNVPAMATVKVEYACKADFTKLNADDKKTAASGKTYYELTNTASMDGSSREAKVRTPEEGEFTFDKILVSRTGKTVTGSGFIVYVERDSDGELKKSGDEYVYGYKGDLLNHLGVSSVTQEDLKKALHAFNAGDYVEYELIVNNQTSEEITAHVLDFTPFYAAYRDPVTKWEYYVKGSGNYFTGNGSTGTTQSDTRKISAVFSENIYGMPNPGYPYQKSDLFDHLCDVTGESEPTSMMTEPEDRSFTTSTRRWIRQRMTETSR